MPLPRVWSTQFPGIIAEGDIAPCHNGRVYAKLLIFGTMKAMRQFAKTGLAYEFRQPLPRATLAFVNELRVEVIDCRKGQEERRRVERDPRYFCVICLARAHLTMEVISHEAVHAAYAYAERVKRPSWWKQVKFQPQEAICYPTGRIAAAINRFLWKRGLWK